MKYLLASAAIFIALWIWSVPAQGAPQGSPPVRIDPNTLAKHKMSLIKEFVLSPLSKDLIYKEGKLSRMPLTFKTLRSKENLTKHDHFDWRYDVHYVTLYGEDETCFLRFQVKVYQEFVSPDSRGFVMWTFVDRDMDGKFDFVERRYNLIMQDRVVMMPEYPEGYINAEWHTVSKEEAQKLLDHEVNYWLGLVKAGT